MSRPSTGDILDLENGTDVPVGARRLQLSASTARTFESRTARSGSMATHIANKPSIHMGHHGPELEAKNAIGTAHHGLGHRDS